ncbi:glycosyltransferase family 4 protein [Cryptosporangium minutisporangium]|uniref:Glycosyltransferase n=1 Tax=Cryptosporangium minutisporangium TaxID=113569 RepID=A0ABP6TCQ6_9ACTN
MSSVQVLHVSHAVNTGLAHCVADYVEYQAKHGVHVTVACPGGRLAALAGARGADVVTWRAARGPGVGMLAEASAFRRIFEEVRPDVVHLHCAKAGLIGRSVLRGRVPTVFSPHAWSFQAVDGALRHAVLGWERYSMRWTDVVICVSAAERDTGIAHGLQGRMEVLPNAVLPTAVEPIRARPRPEVREALGVEPGVPVAVCTARLARQKGQDVLIDAWPAVRAAVPGARLVLVGDGPTRSALEAAAQQAGAEGVHFTGPVDRPIALSWLYASDVVVCPSRWEGMSLVPLEAMALGRPVVVTAVDGMAESVPPGTGWIVPPEDPEALAGAVVTVFSDQETARAAADAGRRRAALTIGDDSSARLLDLYGELLRGRRPQAEVST